MLLRHNLHPILIIFCNVALFVASSPQFCVGVTARNLPVPDYTEDGSSTSFMKITSEDDGIPRIPHELETSPTFRELLSWYDDIVNSWMTRKDVLYENALRDALKDDPALLEYFLNPSNGPFAAIKDHYHDFTRKDSINKKPKNTQTSTQKPENIALVSLPGGSGKIRHSPNLDIRRTTIPYIPESNSPQPVSLPINSLEDSCSGILHKDELPDGVKEASEKIDPMMEDSDDVEKATTGCRFLGPDNKYLICDSAEVTQIPRIPLSLDLFELNSTRVRFLRHNAFHGSNIKTLKLNQNEICYIGPNAFQGLSRTTVTQLMHNSLQWIWFEDSFRGLEHVHTLQLDFNNIRLDRAGNKCVEKLDLNKIGTTLPNLRFLTLRHNPLRIIPRTFFAPLRKSNLTYLSLESCELQDIHPEALLYLRHLKILYLNRNPALNGKLESFFGSLSSCELTGLNLGWNGLQAIPKKAIAHVAETLITLELPGNLFSRLERNSFPNLPQLRALDLSESGFQYIEDGAFDAMTSLVSLRLGGNQFRAIPAPIGSLVNLEILDLSNNITPESGQGPLQIPPRIFENLDKLRLLEFSKSWISQIRKSDFVGLKNLWLLYLDGCKINRIEDKSFSDLSSLEVLNLSENHKLGSEISAETFYGLASLRVLYLNSTGITFPEIHPSLSVIRNNSWSISEQKINKIEDITDDLSTSEPYNAKPNNPTDFATHENVIAQDLETLPAAELDPKSDTKFPFRYLQRLVYLHLYKNDITGLYPGTFSDLPNLEILNLSDNKLESWFDTIFDSNPKLRKISLQGNQIHTISGAMTLDFQSYDADVIDGKREIDLRMNQLQCDIGSCRLKTLVDNEAFTLSEWGNDRSEYFCRETKGKFGKLDLTKLTQKFCEDLSITLPPEDGTPPVNPSPPQDPDIVNPTTSQSPEAPLEPTATPPSVYEENPLSGRDQILTPPKAISVPTILGLGFGSVGIIFLLVSLLYWKATEISYFIFMVKVNVLRRIRRNTRGSDDGFEYDVFISYCHTDSEWIQDVLLPELEGTGEFSTKSTEIVVGNNGMAKQFQRTSSTQSIMANEVLEPSPFFRVCLHIREFQVGAPITENIIDCVDRSRKILIVISQKYMESQWCLFEMNLAYHRLVEGRRDSFVLILLEDIPVESRTKILNHLMKSRTYLEWPTQSRMEAEKSIQHKRIFWKRLRTAMTAEESTC